MAHMFPDKRGVTLIELLVTISISAVLTLLVVQFFSSTLKHSTTVSAHLDAAYYGKKIVANTQQELHRNTQSAAGEYPIVLADDNEMIFFTNLPTFSETVQVRYWLDNTTLYKSITPFSEVTTSYDPANTITTTAIEDCVNIAENTPLFSFYGRQEHVYTSSALQTPAVPTDIGLVTMTLIMQPQGTVTENHFTHTMHVTLNI
ncbi:MAG: prepilin-type N-terminal cleavage/methylation domain-containing protein [Candidatus Magasanikbacteria bacterium]|nr:prepilin-type N-terminal cleavage/methylation domain-containing protein [Candidatus Magasanikbacteria bacterium]